MLLLNSQIQKRIEYDHKAMDDAFRDLVSIVSPGEKEAALKDKEDMARGAIEGSCVGVKVTPVPEEIADLNARLTYASPLRGAAAGGAWESGGRRQRAHCCYKTAMLSPYCRRTGGYTFTTPVSGRVRVTAKQQKDLRPTPSVSTAPCRLKSSIFSTCFFIFRCSKHRAILRS